MVYENIKLLFPNLYAWVKPNWYLYIYTRTFLRQVVKIRKDNHEPEGKM